MHGFKQQTAGHTAEPSAMLQHYAGIAMVFDGEVCNVRAVIFLAQLANDWWMHDD
jgi:hypothetical protein